MKEEGGTKVKRKEKGNWKPIEEEGKKKERRRRRKEKGKKIWNPWTRKRKEEEEKEFFLGLGPNMKSFPNFLE